jgi:membrane associated rhomboid family serine protease
MIAQWFTAPGRGWDPTNPAHYFSLVFHVFGHESWSHLWSNFLILLLLGPILEEKYDSQSFLTMIAVTALTVGVFQVLLAQPPLTGSSAIGFMMIMLVSFARIKPGEIPISLILIFLVYLLNELTRATSDGQAVSAAAHIIGGLCGIIFGFMKNGQSAQPATRPV